MRIIVEDSSYKLYEVYDNAANEYYLCLPNNNDNGEYQVFCGLSNDNISSEDRTQGVKNIYKSINNDGKNIIYVDALVEAKKLMEASRDNDQRLYNFLLDEIHETIRHAFVILKKDKNKQISNVITMVKKNEDDTKFIDWLEINLPTMINSVSLVENYHNDVSDNNDGVPITFTENETVEDVKSKPITKKKTPKNNNHGFGNIILITIVLMLLFFVGITIAYVLIK